MALHHSFLFLVLALVSQAQQAQPTEPVDPKKLATIEGSVFNSATGEALRKVSLTLRQSFSGAMSGGMPPAQSTYAATTDAEGKFRIERVETGSYILSADRQGFVRQQYSQRQPSTVGATLTLSAGQHMKELNFKLAPHAVITGHVFDEDGEPLMRSRIQVLRVSRMRGKRQLMPVGGGETNDLGEFRVHSLPPGRYFVNAMPPNRGQMYGEPAPKNAATEEYITTFYPAALDEASARPIELTSGQNLAAVDIRVKKSPVFHIRGRVSGGPGAGRGMRVQAMPRQQQMGFMFGPGGNVQPDGSFDLPSQPPGSYDVLVMSNQGMIRTLGRAQVEISREDINGLNIAAVDGVAVKGKLRVDGDIQSLEQKLGRKLALNSSRIMLQAMEGINFNNANAMANDEGLFTIENAGPEKYRVIVSGLPPGLWLKAVSVGGHDVIDTGLDLTSGASEPVELVLGVGTGNLSGVVQDSKQQPAPGAIVTLFPEPFKEDRFETLRTVPSDQLGNFKLTNVTPGTYKIYAWEAFDYNTHTDPEFLKTYETRAKLIKIQASGDEALTLAAIPPANP